MLTVTRREFCGSALALAAMGCCAVRAVVESSESVEAYGLSAHQHPRRKMAWTQPLRRP